MFLIGRVASDDSSALPHDVMVERVCNGTVRQQVYASPGGNFSMRLGSQADSFLDASADPTSPYNSSPYGPPRKDPMMGIPRRDLMNCELRASAHGFRPGNVNLLDLNGFGSMMDSVDVGRIVMHRAVKVKGTTVSAVPYKAPKDALKAYEKGLNAKKNGQFAAAQQSFEKAVKLYPKYSSAWFQLGTVLQKQNQGDAARRAYTLAAANDKAFLPAYFSLTLMAYEQEDWTEVSRLTGHIIALDPMNQAALSGYILDLDPLDNTGAYFYNAVANFNLDRMEEAEKSALKAEHLDLRTSFPQVHLLLAEIFARKKNYAAAIVETRAYLDLVPRAKDADQIREQLAKFEQLSASQPATQTSGPH